MKIKNLYLLCLLGLSLGCSQNNINQKELQPPQDQKEAIMAGMPHFAIIPPIKRAIAVGYLLIVMPDSAVSHVKLESKRFLLLFNLEASISWVL